MVVLLFASFVAAFVSGSLSDTGKSGVIEGLRSLTTKKDAIKIQKVIDRIKEDIGNMPKLLEGFSEYNETTDKEIHLSEQQKELLGRLKLLERRINTHKKNFIERVNMKSSITDALFQGDMVLSNNQSAVPPAYETVAARPYFIRKQQDEVIADLSGNRHKRQAHNDKTYPDRKWPKAKVHYSLDGSLDKKAKDAFKKAAEMWMKDTCIDFEEDLEEEAEDLLLVFKERGCWAEVGRQGGWQLLSLGSICGTTGMAAHEIGHALGFWHTHARHDRDNFVTVIKGNIESRRRKNFWKLSKRINNNYNLTYDYGSVMHYGARTFAKNTTEEEDVVTIVPKDVNYMETLGSKFIAFYDLLMMNMYYNCTDACKDEGTQCLNGGFIHPRNCSKCICPSGYGGQLCDERPPSCGEVVNANETWKTLEVNLDDNETGSDGYTRCSYWIKAPIGKKVEIKTLKVPDSSSFEGCQHAGVEIKTHSDQRLTGYRFCSNTFVNTTLTSHSNLVPVIAYSLYESVDQTNGISNSESKTEGFESEDDDYDEDSEDPEYDYGEYEEYDYGNVVKLEYRYI